MEAELETQQLLNQIKEENTIKEQQQLNKLF